MGTGHLRYFCWDAKVRECPKAPVTAPMVVAEMKFHPGEFQYKPGYNTKATDTIDWVRTPKRDDIYEGNCLHLVNYGLSNCDPDHKLGIMTLPKKLPLIPESMTSFSLGDVPGFCPMNTKRPPDIDFGEDPKRPRVGDIIVFGVTFINEAGKLAFGVHVAYITSVDENKDGSYSGKMLELTRCVSPDEPMGDFGGVHAERTWTSAGGSQGKYNVWYKYSDDGTKTEDENGVVSVDENGNYIRKTADFYVAAVLRPEILVPKEKCAWVSDPDPVSEANINRLDPFLLDLDGDGIKTLGLDAGIVFDHDANGFAELTGWVGEGDGILMLDLNGNNKLDDGRELFGDSMPRPNGMSSSHGFQVLSDYDSNNDGRIDASDPVWDSLRVWQSSADSLVMDVGCSYSPGGG